MNPIGMVKNYADVSSLGIIALWKESISAITTTTSVPFSDQHTHYIIIHDSVHKTYDPDHDEWNRRFTESKPIASIVEYLFTKNDTHFVRGLFAEDRASIYSVMPFTSLDQVTPAPRYPENSVGEMRRKVIHKVVPSVKGGVILDIACGVGSIALQIAQGNPGSTIYGIDNVKGLASQCQFNAEALGIHNVNFMTVRAEELSFKDNTFEMLTCFFSLHHFKNPGEAIREMYRVLENGGTAITADPLSHHHGTIHTMEEWNGLFEEAGFTASVKNIAGAAVVTARK